MCVRTPVDELKGNCAGYAEKEEINWIGILMNGTNVDMQRSRNVDGLAVNVILSMKMNK